MQIIYFLILIGVLIFIHEFGHYFFAKLFGVKVERFAIATAEKSRRRAGFALFRSHILYYTT